MENTVTINGMDDVVSTLQRLLDSPDTDVSYRIDVQNLPDFELYLKGEKFDNSITPSIMKGVIELQKSIYRAYLIARYGSDNLQMLNNYERSALELRVIVQPGSTDLVAKMCDVAIKLFELINGMENRQKYIIILTVLAIIGSGVGWMFFDSYLKHEATKLDMSKELLIERERTKQLLETQKNTIDAVQMAIKSQHITDNTEVPQSNPLNNEEEVPVVEEETPPNNTAATNNENKAVHFKQLKKTDVELIAVVEKAKNFDEKVELASARTEESMRKLMASTASADFVRFNNQFEASGNTMQQIASTEKVESEDITIRKLFRVLNIDSKSTEFMQARLRPNDQSYPDFNAAFSDNSISQEKLDRLTTALTSYHPIDLSITAKKKRGKLDKAFIAQVRNIDTTKSFKQQTEESTDV